MLRVFPDGAELSVEVNEQSRLTMHLYMKYI
jgi:hypothetical protein